MENSIHTANRYLEAGTIVSTHGVRGEVKLKPACDSAEFLMPLNTLYKNGEAMHPISKRVHKGMLLLLFPGYDTVEKAMRLVHSTFYFDRMDIQLPSGVYYYCDLIGLSVYDTRLGRNIGTIVDILDRPASNIYVLRDGDTESMIPAAGDFIQSIDLEHQCMTVQTIPGMVSNE